MDSVEPSVYSGHNLENFIFATNLNDYINEELVYLDNMNKPASNDRDSIPTWVVATDRGSDDSRTGE